jgi:hypothetical protein
MFEKQLAEALSKKVIDNVVQTVLEQPALYDELYMLVESTNSKVAWRAAWALSHLCAKDSSFFTQARMEQLTGFLLRTENESIQRTFLSIIQKLSLPDYPVELINRCFEWMLLPQKPIAIQAYCMYILVNVCKKHPEFREELIVSLENAEPSFYTKGFASARKNVLKQISKIKK